MAALLLGGEIERAPHDCGFGRRLESFAEARFRLCVQRLQAFQENVARPLFEAGRGEIGQRLSCNGKYFLLRSATNGLAQLLRVASQRLASLRAQRVGGFARFVEEPLAFGFRVVGCFGQERGALLVELVVLVLEIVALFFGFGLLRGGSRRVLWRSSSRARRSRAGLACKESAATTRRG